MNYFVTGATGFIGRFVVAGLLQRDRKAAETRDAVPTQRRPPTPLHGLTRQSPPGC